MLIRAVWADRREPPVTTDYNKMASIYFRGKSPAGSWWLQFYHPESGELLRFSLGSGDGAYADLVRRRVEIELALLDRAISSVELPPEIATAAGIQPPAPIVVPAPLPEPTTSPSPAREPLTVEAALAHYLAHVRAENDYHHVEGKISMLRQLFGSGLFPYKANNNRAKPLKAFFSGKTIDELTPEVVLQFLNAGSLSRKTMRHYRELLHHLFEILLKTGKIEPANYHTPNPMSSLPAFLDKGRARIVFLRAEDKKAQEAALAGSPSLLAGYPIEKQLAVLTQLCHQLLRVVSDLLLTLIDAPRAKVRQVNQARSRLTALLGICFAEASWEEFLEAGNAAGPISTYGFGQFLADNAGDRETEALASAN